MTIAYDTSTTGSIGGSATLTYSHTCTGNNRTLVVVSCSQILGGAEPTGITYNSVALTKIDSQANTNPNLTTSMWYLASPATGANNVVITYTVPQTNIVAVSVSLTGTAGSPIGVSSKTNGASTTPSLAVSTGTVNSWVVSSLGIGDEPTNPTTTGTNQTSRNSIGISANLELWLSTQTTTSTGSYTSSWSKTGSAQWSMINAEIKVFPAVNNTITIAQGAYTYTGFATLFTKGHRIVMATGAYTLTGFNLLFTYVQKWIDQAKNTSVETNASKNTSTWVDQSKNTSVETNQTKN